MRVNPKDEKRFWAKVDKAASCWLWLGAVFAERGGYGQFYIKRDGRYTNNYAHRVAYELCNGPISDGLLVMHTCNNPRCVNPEHLVMGTQAENMAFCSTSGRAYGGARHWTKVAQLRLRGERNPATKLCAFFARLCIDMVRDGATQRQAAQLFGVSQQRVSQLVKASEDRARSGEPQG